MRCPHCGYVSFDGLSACRRCANPLPPGRRSAAIPPPHIGPSVVHRLPLSSGVVQEESGRVGHAGFFRRWVAFLIDAPLLFVLTVLAMTLTSLMAVGGGTVAGEVTLQVALLALGASLLAAFGVSLGYHVLCWGWGGQTPGKMLMGLQVVKENGEELGYGCALLRWVGYLCALLPLGLGFMVALFHPHGRGLHDLLAGTCVTRVDSGTKQ